MERLDLHKCYLAILLSSTEEFVNLIGDTYPMQSYSKISRQTLSFKDQQVKTIILSARPCYVNSFAVQPLKYNSGLPGRVPQFAIVRSSPLRPSFRSGGIAKHIRGFLIATSFWEGRRGEITARNSYYGHPTRQFTTFKACATCHIRLLFYRHEYENLHADGNSSFQRFSYFADVKYMSRTNIKYQLVQFLY